MMLYRFTTLCASLLSIDMSFLQKYTEDDTWTFQKYYNSYTKVNTIRKVIVNNKKSVNLQDLICRLTDTKKGP